MIPQYQVLSDAIHALSHSEAEEGHLECGQYFKIFIIGREITL